MEDIKEVVTESQEQDNSAVKSTNVDNVDKIVDYCVAEDTVVDKLNTGYIIRIPADEDMLNQTVEYFKFAEIPYEVVN